LLCWTGSAPNPDVSLPQLKHILSMLWCGIESDGGWNRCIILSSRSQIDSKNSKAMHNDKNNHESSITSASRQNQIGVNSTNRS
jgi:hypothetical protein